MEETQDRDSSSFLSFFLNLEARFDSLVPQPNDGAVRFCRDKVYYLYPNAYAHIEIWGTVVTIIRIPNWDS